MSLSEKLLGISHKLSGLCKRIAEKPDYNRDTYKEYNEMRDVVNEALSYVIDCEMAEEREGMLRMELEAAKLLNGMLYSQINEYRVLIQLRERGEIDTRLKEIDEMIENKTIKNLNV